MGIVEIPLARHMVLASTSQGLKSPWMTPTKKQFPAKLAAPTNRISVSSHGWFFAVGRVLIGVILLARAQVHGATGTIFYNHVVNAEAAPTVRVIRADGSNDFAVPIALPFAAHPTVSRDGKNLLVTTADPVVPQMRSYNVFSVDLASGTTTRITHYVDTISDGVTTYTNVFNEPDFQGYSYYTSHLPYYKAYSPTADRVAILDLTAVSGKPPGGVRLAPIQAPVLEVYPVQQTFPIGEFLFAGAERTGLNQAGDGVDWHPTTNQLLGTFRQNIPTTGNLGPGLTEGTVIKIYRESGLNPFVTNLTAPTGTHYVDFINFFIVDSTAQDYAPAISRDGTKVAYVRNTLASDSRTGLGFVLTNTSIRIINYDGTGDQELLSFGPGRWVTRLSWSPDDTEIAFDIAPQLVVNGLKLQMGNITNSEIKIVRVSDKSVQLLVPAPAAFPSWSPLDSIPQRPRIRLTPRGSQFELDLSNLVIGRQTLVESTTNLVQWTTNQSFTATAPTQKFTNTPPPQSRATFFRIRMP
jgi:hypothetical protein